MKHIKKYEMWTTNVTGDYDFNYGDKKPELSEIVIEVINYIKDNYDKISTDVLNDTTEFGVGFNFSEKNGMKYDKIRIEKNKKNSIPYIHFLYYDYRGTTNGYDIDITDYDYEYLHDYFFKIYKEFKKKDEIKKIEKHKSELKKIEEEKAKNSADKYNL
jgi:hypothetical protein